jgi:hypothetical protein
MKESKSGEEEANEEYENAATHEDCSVLAVK